MKNSRKGGRIMETKDEKVLKEPFAEIGRKMHLLLHTGQLLMENGADSDRTVRDMMRTAAYMGIPKDRIHQHVMYTTLMLNVNDEQHSYTEFRKCTKHGINMTTLTAISKLTWRALEKNYSLHEFERHLLRIKNRPRNYPVWLTALGAGAPAAASASSSAAAGSISCSQHSAPSSASTSGRSAPATPSTHTPSSPSPRSRRRCSPGPRSS